MSVGRKIVGKPAYLLVTASAIDAQNKYRVLSWRCSLENILPFRVARFPRSSMGVCFRDILKHASPMAEMPSGFFAFSHRQKPSFEKFLPNFVIFLV